MITLTDGRQVDESHIVFDRATYHFTINSEDITNLIKPSDKMSNWNDFDISIDNTRLYNERRGGVGPVDNLNDSTTSILTDQLLTDPLGAPLDALDKGVNQIIKSRGIQIGLVGVAVVLIIVALVERRKG